MAFYLDDMSRFKKGLLKIAFGAACGATIYGLAYASFGIIPFVMAAFDRNASIVDYATTPIKWLHDGVRDCNYAMQEAAFPNTMKDKPRGFRYFS